MVLRWPQAAFSNLKTYGMFKWRTSYVGFLIHAASIIQLPQIGDAERHCSSDLAGDAPSGSMKLINPSKVICNALQISRKHCYFLHSLKYICFSIEVVWSRRKTINEAVFVQTFNPPVLYLYSFQIVSILLQQAISLTNEVFVLVFSLCWVLWNN